MGVHCAVTLPLAKILNTWVDETYTLHTTAQTASYALAQALRFELQPPLYFVLLTLWRELDHSIFFARLFSVLCAALTVYLSAQLSRRYIPTINPAWTAALIAINPALIWAALEIRVYAFAALLSALLLLTLYDGYVRIPGSRSARVWHVVLAVLAVYTQYFLGFLLLGIAAALALTRRWQPLRAYLASLVPVAVLCLPLVYVLHAQIHAATNYYYSTNSLPSVFLQFYTAWFGYVLPLSWAHPVMRLFHGGIGLFAVGVAAAAALHFWGAPTRLQPARALLWAISCVMAVALVAAFFITKEPFGVRYAFIVFVPLVLAALAEFAALEGRRRWAAAVWLILFVPCALVTLVNTYAPLAKTGDWQRVAAFIQANERSDQPILAFQTENALSLQDYYHGRNAVVAVPRPISFAGSWNENEVVRNEAEIAADLKDVPGRHELVWAVTTSECHDYSVDYHCPIFEHFIATHFSVALEREFFGSRVRLLKTNR